MGLFQKNDGKKSKAPERNPDRVFGFRLLAVGYIGYTVYKVFSMYFEGGEEMPEIWMLVLSGLLGLAALPSGLLLRGQLFSFLNFAYVCFQDRVTFPKTFCDYEDYQQKVPFLIPTRSSIRQAAETLLRANREEDKP